MHQRAGYRSPLLCMLVTDHDQIDRDTHWAQRFTQSHELSAAALQLRLNHEQVKIGSRLGVSTRMGAEEDDPRIGGSLGEATTSLGDQFLIGHMVKVADDLDGFARPA